MRKVKTMAREIKKLSSDSDSWAIIGTINDLIDDVMALNRVITSDIVRIATDEIIDELSGDGYRPVTLNIPRDKTIAEAITQACGFSKHGYFLPDDKKLTKLLKEQS